jgi:hypothetical protein
MSERKRKLTKIKVGERTFWVDYHAAKQIEDTFDSIIIASKLADDYTIEFSYERREFEFEDKANDFDEDSDFTLFAYTSQKRIRVFIDLKKSSKYSEGVLNNLTVDVARKGEKWYHPTIVTSIHTLHATTKDVDLFCAVLNGIMGQANL